jgi:hypothetical protein
MTFANDVRIYERIVELHETMVNEWKAESSDPDFITQCMFQSIPTIFAQHGIEKGGNMLGLDRLEENVVMLLLDIAVKSADLEILARNKLRSFGEQIQEYAASLDGLIEWRYLNYADYYQVCANLLTLRLANKFSESSWKLRPEERGQNSQRSQALRSEWLLPDKGPGRFQDIEGCLKLQRQHRWPMKRSLDASVLER